MFPQRKIQVCKITVPTLGRLIFRCMLALGDSPLTFQNFSNPLSTLAPLTLVALFFNDTLKFNLSTQKHYFSCLSQLNKVLFPIGSM